MCLILFAYQVHPVYKLIVAANRDESYQRATAPVHFWEDSPEILAGRDLEKMGTWMGVTKSGRFAALTNFRNPKEKTEGKRSRGELVANALTYMGNVKEYMQNLAGSKDQYPGYNLLAGDGDDLYYYSNIGQEFCTIKPGIHGVSNHLLNTDWPKVQKGMAGMSKIIKENKRDITAGLLTLLENSDPAPDELLPNTGVPLDLERILSPLFIKSSHYGTRSSTVILMSETKVQLTERVFHNGTMKNQQYTIDL